MSYGSPPPPQYVSPYSPGQPPHYAPYGPPPVNPYGPPGYVQPPPATGWSCGAIGLVVIGVLTVVCCGGFGGLAYYGIQLLHGEAQEALAAHPVVRERLGKIREFKVVSFDITDSDETDYVMDLVGERGAARAEFRFNDELGTLRGELRLPDGTSVPLDEE